MAFVGISKTLLQEVLGNINRLRDTELNTVAGTDPMEGVLVTGEEAWFVKQVWGEHLHLKAVVPKSWLAENKRLNLQFRILDDAESTLYHFNHVVTLPEPITIPPVYRTYYSDSRAELKVVFYMNDPAMPENIRTKIKMVAQVQEIKTRWEKVRTNVVSFLDQCKSLNEAIKLWPDLRVYIPSSYLEKLDRKAERKAGKESNAAEMLKTIDVNEVQAAAVIARLSGANL
jgi:hypothetical protein